MKKEFEITKYGFKWNGTQIDRIASEINKRNKFAIIRVTCPNKTVYEIQMTPRKTYILKLINKGDK